MKEPLVWRKAQNNDSLEIKALIRQVMSEYGFQMPGTFWTAMPEPDVINQSGFIGVVIQEGRIGGTYGFQPLPEGTAEIQKVYLERDLRGQQIGKEMVLLLEQIIRARHFQKITLLSSGRYTKALKLYDQLGYVRLPRLEGASEFCDWRLEKILTHG